MECYIVTFHCIGDLGEVDISRSFYSEDCIDLAEQIIEAQEDIEETSTLIIVSKTIKQVQC